MKQTHEIIRDLREDHDLTQSDVAAILGTSQQYYSQYEAGRYELPIRFLKKLAEYYNVTSDYLLGLTKCPIKVIEHKLLTENYATDNLIADILSLDAEAREDIVKYINLQKKASGRQ